MRSLSSAAVAALASPMVPLCLFIQMDLTTTTRMCLAGVNVEYGGYTWIGVSTVGSMDAIFDSAGQKRGVRFTLSSVPTGVLYLALSEPMQGKKVTISLGIGDPSTYQIIESDVVWTGTLDQPSLDEGDKSGAVTIQAIHRGDTFARPKTLRYTDADQQRLFPGDLSLQYINSQANHQDVWPSAAWGRK